MVYGVTDVVQPVLLRLHSEAFQDVLICTVGEANLEIVARFGDEARIDECFIALRNSGCVQLAVPFCDERVDACLLFGPPQFGLRAEKAHGLYKALE